MIRINSPGPFDPYIFLCTGYNCIVTYSVKLFNWSVNTCMQLTVQIETRKKIDRVKYYMLNDIIWTCHSCIMIYKQICNFNTNFFLNNCW